VKQEKMDLMFKVDKNKSEIKLLRGQLEKVQGRLAESEMQQRELAESNLGMIGDIKSGAHNLELLKKEAE
jgi:hypothetical protein